VLGAEWSEFDLKARAWIVPASRMKASREKFGARGEEGARDLERFAAAKNFVQRLN
jgi:hypothetical protein